MKAKINVYEIGSSKIIASFSSIADLEKANEKHNWNADQIEVNGMLLMGWDELYDFV